MTRDDLVEILTEIIQASCSRLAEAHLADGLKAAEMLAKTCGWNEPERKQVQHMQLQVDSFS